MQHYLSIASLGGREHSLFVWVGWSVRWQFPAEIPARNQHFSKCPIFVWGCEKLSSNAKVPTGTNIIYGDADSASFPTPPFNQWQVGFWILKLFSLFAQRHNLHIIVKMYCGEWWLKLAKKVSQLWQKLHVWGTTNVVCGDCIQSTFQVAAFLYLIFGWSIDLENNGNSFIWRRRDFPTEFWFFFSICEYLLSCQLNREKIYINISILFAFFFNNIDKVQLYLTFLLIESGSNWVELVKFVLYELILHHWNVGETFYPS